MLHVYETRWTERRVDASKKHATLRASPRVEVCYVGIMHVLQVFGLLQTLTDPRSRAENRKKQRGNAFDRRKDAIRQFATRWPIIVEFLRRIKALCYNSRRVSVRELKKRSTIIADGVSRKNTSAKWMQSVSIKWMNPFPTRQRGNRKSDIKGCARKLVTWKFKLTFIERTFSRDFSLWRAACEIALRREKKRKRKERKERRESKLSKKRKKGERKGDW